MLYMAVEHFKDPSGVPVYRRFRERGRMAPEGLEYISSWVQTDYALKIETETEMEWLREKLSTAGINTTHITAAGNTQYMIRCNCKRFEPFIKFPDVSEATTGAGGRGSSSRSTIVSAIRRPNTNPSSSEFYASRFAPCTPVQATSPQANSPGTPVRPCRSVLTPPLA